MTLRAKNENAVVFLCNPAYVTFALFVIWQIRHHNPDPNFDFVIYSPDDITLPAWAETLNVQTLRAKPLADVPKNALFNGMDITLYRFGLARELEAQYRRLLYLDTDLFVEGGDFNRLFAMDLQGMPVGGVLDVLFMHNEHFWATEFRLAGISARPYMNAGLQLIDTQAYQEHEIERLAWAVMKEIPHAICSSDQSILNLVLKGRFAELSPRWNWQRNVGLPLVTMRYPVFVRHFITERKPDRDASGLFDARFNLAYREFFARHDPEFLSRLAPPCDPSPMSLKEAAKLVWAHMASRAVIQRMIARHPDPYLPRIPQMKLAAKQD